MHLANTLFQIKVRQKKYGCRLQWFITVHVSFKEPYEMSMAWEPDRRSNFFFSPPAHLCAVTYMTEISLIVTLNNQLPCLAFTDQAKYLGVTIDTKHSWGHHTNTIIKKANNTVAFLRRNLSSCPRQIRATCYKSLVRPQLEYASTVWDHTNKTHINTVEAVQRRAARFITGDYRQESSVTAMLHNLQLESLQERRLRAWAVMMFRVVSNLIDLSSGPLHQSEDIHSDIYNRSAISRATRTLFTLPALSSGTQLMLSRCFLAHLSRRLE